MKALKATPIVVTALAIFLTSCTTLQPGADPIIVNAERTVAVAVDVFDTFLRYEYEHREQLKGVPAIRVYAETIRRDGVKWLQSARAATRAYKVNRSPENKASVITTIAVIETAVQESRKYIAAF